MAAYTQAQLITAFTYANAGIAPTAAQQQTLLAYANQNATGSLTDPQALQMTVNLAADSTTAVSVGAYQFFTGVAPSAAGLAALGAAYGSAGTQANLNGENRFIAQSVSLATQNTAAKTAFTTAYGSLSVAAATAQAYDVIIGNTTAAAAGINVANAVAYLSSAASVTYFTNFIKQNTSLTAAADIDLAVKAAIVGEIMFAATSYNSGAGIGSYATATNNLLLDLAADGKLVADNASGINLFTAYPGGETQGQNFALTLDQDTLVGTNANDVFNANFLQDNNGASKYSLQTFDSIDGGSGTDRLNVTLDGTFAAAAPALKSVEEVSIRAAAADGISLAGSTGVTNVIVHDSAGIATVTNAGSAALTVNDQAVGVVLAGTAATTSTLNFNNVTTAALIDLGAAAANKATTVTINTNASSVKIDSTVADVFTTATINATGKNTVVFTDSAATLTAVTATGAGSIDLSGASLNALKTFDGSAGTGAQTVATTGVAATSIKTGAGADSVTISGALKDGAVVNLGDGADTFALTAAQTNKFTVDAGAGVDTIQVTDGANLTAGVGKMLTGFETLATGAGKGVYDVTAVSGITAVAVDGALAAATTIDNLTTQSVTISASQTKVLTLDLKDSSGTSDSLSFTIKGKADVTGVSVVTTGVETINIASSTSQTKANVANTITGLDVTDATKIVFTGDYHLKVGGFANDATVTEVNASGLTKGVEMTSTLAGTQSVIYVGGAGDDTFLGNGTAGPAGDTFKGGAGADTVTLAAAGQSDTIIYSAATDSVLTVSATLVTSGFDKIGAFTVAEDKIDLSTLGFTGFAAGGVKSLGALANITTTSITDLFDVAGSDRGVAFGTNGGNTYVFIDTNHDGNFTAAGDLFIELTGVTTALSVTDFSFA